MKKVIQLIAIGAACLSLAACGSKAVYNVMAADAPSADNCLAVAELGAQVVDAGDKAEVARDASVAATPLSPLFAKVAVAIGGALSGGGVAYETVNDAWQAKCPQVLGGAPNGK